MLFLYVTMTEEKTSVTGKSHVEGDYLPDFFFTKVTFAYEL